ncbi:MAG TPA: family 1 glycosylhydrolase [Tepidisphaeraceae bacterium]|nr:family 1 glycosylhydrolase [Tepidisphaeraceae bacterium]
MNSTIAHSDSAVTPAPRPAVATVDSLPFKQFIWGAGLECSFLPHLNVDQFDWTQHNTFWKEDLKRAKDECGITHLRYAFPWHKLETSPGKFDWSYADERIEYADKMGITFLLDVMHFGTPLWLKQAVGDPEFPEALERFSHALVSRYASSVNTFCPFNEPLVSALFSGDFGFWPPHSRKWRGYMPVLSRIVQAVSRGIRAIREASPGATVLLCDAAENYKTRDAELKQEVARRNLRRFVVMDLLTGRVYRHHPLFAWLTSYGMSELDLEWFKTHQQTPDVLGLDYYQHSDWQLEKVAGGTVRQRRADSPVGLYGIGKAYYDRYGIPIMLTETSIEGQPINREIWLEDTVDHIRRLREEGIPMLGYIWWPMLDQLDWDGAMTHRIGKLHEVGLFKLTRQKDGTLTRKATPLVDQFKEIVAAGEERVGKLEQIAFPAGANDEQLPPLGEWIVNTVADPVQKIAAIADGKHQTSVEGKGRLADAVPGLGAESAAATLSVEATITAEKSNGNGNGHGKPASSILTAGTPEIEIASDRDTGRYGIVVFSHLRWGFVWQRPQQFLSRFAKKHPVLFIEEPFFDKPEGAEPEVQYHKVMPNVTVACPHVPASYQKNPKLPQMLQEWAHKAIRDMNEEGEFDRPLLWYYSPMDSSWSLGHFENRGVVYDCMDELSQFTGAPKQLVANEARLIDHADVVFTGGYNLGEKKRKQHPNVHTFGCGVEFSHFNKAADPTTALPPDVDFMNRPIIGWFGVVDERVDYTMVGEMARMRPDWSFAMVGPVVKVDPNLLPHAPNLFWMGGRDYQQLPNYVAAFDVCMMCFAINAATEFINPTKGLEYMATGKPVVGTHVKDVVNQWSDIVLLAKGTEEFVGQIQKALNRNDADVAARINKGLDLAKRSSWEGTVRTMQNLIKEAISKPDRRSAKKIAPMADAELEYLYTHTQGS